MKSLVSFAALSPVLMLGLGACSPAMDAPDELVGETASEVASIDNAAVVGRPYTAEYASDYLVPGVTMPVGPGFHQMTMSWFRNDLGAGGVCQIDPNACALDAFGDRTICTRMAVAGSEIMLTPFAEKSGAEAYAVGTRPYGSTDGYTALPWRLVIIAAQGSQPAQARLLILNPDRTIERIIELHRLQH